MRRALLLAVVAFLPMLAEAARSRRHERVLRARGATEPEDDVYPLMQVAYPGCFLAMAVEAWWRNQPPTRWTAGGLVVFAAAKGLKYWAITALGERWTFRVLVEPDAPLVDHGPYRWLRHPNYLGIAGELTGGALIAGAPITGAAAVAAFGTLLRARIRVEERALHIAEH